MDKSIKIKNISQPNQDLTFYIKTEDGKDVLIKLSHGEFIYSQDQETRHLKVYNRKNLLTIEPEEIPVFADLYKVYTENNFVQNKNIENKTQELQEQKEEISDLEKIEIQVEKYQNNNSFEEDVVEESVSQELEAYSHSEVKTDKKPKNKKGPGRPKKRGPKPKKKPIGRPKKK